MSETLDDMMQESPEEKTVRQARWTRESMISEAVRLINARAEGPKNAAEVIETAQAFVAFIEGETK